MSSMNGTNNVDEEMIITIPLKLVLGFLREDTIYLKNKYHLNGKPYYLRSTIESGKLVFVVSKDDEGKEIIQVKYSSRMGVNFPRDAWIGPFDKVQIMPDEVEKILKTVPENNTPSYDLLVLE